VRALAAVCCGGVAAQAERRECRRSYCDDLRSDVSQLLVGIFSTALGCGYTTVAWISFGSYHAGNATLQWRLPLALACVSPLLQTCGCWFLPESPRWLVQNNRTDEAWTVVRRLHLIADDPNDTVAHAEYTQVCEQVAYDKQFTNVGYAALFRKPSWRKRSLLVIFVLFSSQSTGKHNQYHFSLPIGSDPLDPSAGVLGIGNYKVLIYQSLGLTGGMPIMMNAIYTMIGTAMVIIGSWLADRVGRRKMLRGFPLPFVGTVLCIC
jgi:hypothetical protein